MGTDRPPPGLRRAEFTSARKRDAPLLETLPSVWKRYPRKMQEKGTSVREGALRKKEALSYGKGTSPKERPSRKERAPLPRRCVPCRRYLCQRREGFCKAASTLLHAS